VSASTLHRVWLDAWREAVRATWPTPPRAVSYLVRLAGSLEYYAPEDIGRPVASAWDVYYHEGDTPAGRAAVALAHVIGLRRAS
jgi:hypothetical protein